MSDWYQIENHVLTMQVVTKGAELKRLFNKVWNRELLWNGDEKIWNRSSPILFPIVGKLIDDEYVIDDNLYTMSQHGFARDSEFVCKKCEHDYIELVLVSNQDLLKKYPYKFELNVSYYLIGNDLEVKYTVKNIDQKEMFFSIGAHPAFRTNPGHDYVIQFEKEEKEFFQTYKGIIDFNKSIPFSSNNLIIEPNTFKNDALILKNLRSNYVDLVDKKNKELIRIKDFNSDFFAIWSKGNIPFICLEPWLGVNDQVGHDKNLKRKKGIQKLNSGEELILKFTIECNLWSEEVEN